jgi:hypothetical protein
MQLTADLSQIPPTVRAQIIKNLREEDQAKMAMARIRQIQAAKLYNDAATAGTTKAHIGPCSMVMDPYWVSYFRRVHGETIFQDEDFIKHLKRKGDPFFVREAASKIQVGHGDCAGGSKFRKRYEWPVAVKQALAK